MCVYMSDQETAIGTMVEAALRSVGKTWKRAGGVPENRAVGESQTNGRAKSAVKEIEGHVRTHKCALEYGIRKRIPSDHPITRWLIEHSATTLSTYALHDDGSTITLAYETLRGKRAEEKLAELGERVLFWIPTRRRAKLDTPCQQVSFLRAAMHTNEAFIAMPDGDVIRTGASCRIRQDPK